MPAFDTQCIRTYITASELPSQGVAGSTHNWEHNPRLAPPDALPEKINPDEHTFVRGAKNPLAQYSEHGVPTKYSRIIAVPGSPFQIHFMVWSQQTIPEFDFPGDFNEPEFMDLRVEVSFNSEVVDTGYINHRNITYGGIPFGLEITGKTVGDSVEIPFMFNGGPSTELSEDGSPKQLKNAQIDVLVTGGRLGPYLTYQRNRNRKVIKVAPFCPLVSYESSVADKSFTGYEWFRENKDMMFDRDENPDTKLWEWRRGWAEADVYRQQVEARAYWERKISMRHITLKSVFRGSPVPQNPEFPPIPTVQQILQLNGCSDQQIMEASGSPSTNATSPSSNASSAPKKHNVSSVPQSPAMEPPRRKPIAMTRKTTIPGRGPSKDEQEPDLKRVTKVTSYPECPQMQSRWNIAFGDVGYSNGRDWYQDFVPYMDICRFTYEVVNPE